MAKQQIRQAGEKDYIALWREYYDSFKNDTPAVRDESATERKRRIARLEAKPEEWFKYYFPKYCTAEPADFHKRATRRLLKNKEWMEVRAWSRELAKSARSMMEICYLALTGQTQNVLIVSNSQNNAERLLLPLKTFFEASPRVQQDYGMQQTVGKWEATEFTIKRGCAFRALGWGQSPRGTRKENVRPDFILIDDIDTDEECRNEDIQRNKINWIEQALYATRSISNSLRVLVNGNIIHNNCVVKKLGEKADHFDIVNIRNEAGRSTWPEKNREEDIDRVLSLISYESAQKEYFNNPMDGSETFRGLRFGALPRRLEECAGVIYADPSTSNRDVSSGSMKAVVAIVAHEGIYYIAKVRLDTMSNARFVESLFELHAWMAKRGVQNVRVWIENNTLQNPFYEQVLMPQIYAEERERKVYLPVMGDERAKGDKYTRIEANLEPLHRGGRLIFAEEETSDEDMQRLKAQFENFSRKQKRMDGPDAVEGGIFKLMETEASEAIDSIVNIKRKNSKRL